MGEPQYFPSQIIAGTLFLVDGIEEQNEDSALMGQSGGLADDRVLAELLRLPPSTPPQRGIIPYETINTIGTTGPGHTTVESSGSANGSIRIRAFRAVVGSTTNFNVSQLAYWRDIRSGIWVSSDPTIAGVMDIGLAPNSSGNTRWDLVYASITRDAPTNAQSRRVKDPSSESVTVQNIYQYLSQPVTVTVLAGTPSATPTIPAVPADSGSVYNIALAAVRVPTGFTSGSTILGTDIRALANCLTLASSGGVSRIAPATGQNDRDGFGTGGLYTNFAWSTSSGPTNRPAPFMPPDMTGGASIFVQIESGTPANPSHANGAVIDSSIDWRNRLFKVTVAGSSLAVASNTFATQPGTFGGSSYLPNNLISASLGFTGNLPVGSWFDYCLSHSMSGNAPSQTVVYVADNATTNGRLTGSMTMGINVDMSTGSLIAVMTNSPVGRMFVWIEASGQFTNFS